MKNKPAGKSIIVGVTGSIAAYKACEVVSCLRKDGYDMKVIMTEAAKNFITPLTLQTLSGNRVYAGGMFETVAWQPEHVGLAETAGLILIAPASADVIAKLAAGIADELLTCVVLAARCPVVIAPAMNENMYLNKITQGNIKKLSAAGFEFITPGKGWLACGSEGTGRLAEPQIIVKRVKEILGRKTSSK